jgi:hypothetical protein
MISAASPFGDTNKTGRPAETNSKIFEGIVCLKIESFFKCATPMSNKERKVGTSYFSIAFKKIIFLEGLITS